MTSEAVLIVNVRSRAGAEAAQKAASELGKQGIGITRTRVVSRGRELAQAVREAVSAGQGVILIAGGDGTLSAAVDFLANRPDLTLGLLPTGTGNDTARILGIPLDLAGASRVVAEGQVEEVDLAQADGNYFVHTALIGYPAWVNSQTPTGLKSMLGKVAYAYSFLAALLTLRPFRARVTAGAQSWEGETPLIVVGNRRFHAPAQVLLPPESTSRPGLLIYGPRDGRVTTLLRLALALLVTRRPQPSLLFSLSADEAFVETDPPQPTDLDGEYAKPTPIKFRLAPCALRVLVPRSESTPQAQDAV